jgi:hypothetical protein
MVLYMTCRSAHEWYELQRGTVSRGEGETLRRHLAECPECRARAAGVRDVAALLEQLAAPTRADLPAAAAEAVLRRARADGLLGKAPAEAARQPVRWNRVLVRLAASLAAVFVLAAGLKFWLPANVYPQGALVRLVRSAHGITVAENLRPLAVVARAAVTEELARPAPSADQVADLLLVSHICQSPREDRQAQDVNFLLGSIWDRHKLSAPASAARAAPPWPMLATVAAVGGKGVTPAERSASPLAAAKARLLAGNYKGALAILPKDPTTAVLRAWCAEALGYPLEAAQVLAKNQAVGGAMARVLRADLALGAKDVAEAVRQYESLAAQADRYWFAAGYLWRYELNDARSAGRCFSKVRDKPLAKYVAQEFQAELWMAKVPESPPLFTEDFDAFSLGAPTAMALVRTRGGEFRIVDVPGGRALCQEELNTRGAEILTGDPDWTDYTLKFDVKIIETKGDYAIGASACRRAGQTGYVVELSSAGLRIFKQFALTVERARALVREGLAAPSEHMLLQPTQAHAALEEAPVVGWWYTMKIRVQRVGDNISVAGKAWRSDAKEPLDWQVMWTDTGQGGTETFIGGAAGIQIGGAKVLIDNVIVTRNESQKESRAGAL